MVAMKAAVLKWARARGTWDLAGSVKWYIYSGILLLAYEPEGPQFDLQWSQSLSGIPLPDLSFPWAVIALANISLAVALSLLVEPLLAYRCRRWVSRLRDNPIIHGMEGPLELSVLFVGVLSLYISIADTLKMLPWLQALIIWLGLVLIVAWVARHWWRTVLQVRLKTH